MCRLLLNRRQVGHTASFDRGKQFDMDKLIKTLTDKDCTVHWRWKQNWATPSISSHAIRCVVGPVGVKWLRCYTEFISSNTDFCMEDQATPCRKRDCESSYIDLNAFFLFFGAGGVPHFSWYCNHVKPHELSSKPSTSQNRALNR